MPIQDSYTTGDNTQAGAYGVNWIAQAFLASASYDIVGIRLKLYRTGLPGTVTVSIRAATLYAGSTWLPTGGDLAVGTINGNDLPESSPGGTFPDNGTEIIFSAVYSLAINTPYTIVVRSAGINTNNKVNWSYDNSGAYNPNPPKQFCLCSSSNSGSSWSYTPASDFIFATYNTADFDEGTLVVSGAGHVWIPTESFNSPPTAPERPDDYDPDGVWDEETHAWVTVEDTGPGRNKTQLIVVGQTETGDGCVYYGDF